MSHDVTKAEMLPPNFIYSPDDPFYYGPATCEFLHYRTGALVGAAIEHFIQAAAVSIAFYLYSELKSLEFFVVVALASFLVVSTLCTLCMLYGLRSENAHFVKPKMIAQQLQIIFLLSLATISIVAMCFGIEMTNDIFSHFLSVPEIERDFGPIWPFNISVLAFMAAALGVWTHVLSSGAHEYLLDKNFFANSSRSNIALQSRKRDD